MRWVNGEEHNYKINRLKNWHDWFAWHPVSIGITNNGHKRMVWLEMIKRKGTQEKGFGRHGARWYWYWEYKDII